MELDKEEKLKEIRAEIDHFDDQLIILLQQRASKVMELAKVKRPLVQNIDREQAILQRLISQNLENKHYTLDQEFIKNLWTTIFSYSLKIQQTDGIGQK